MNKDGRSKDSRSKDGRQDRLERLIRVLDVYGAREERWPEAIRTELSAFIATDTEAVKLLAEARALAKVLAFPLKPAGTAALESRILMAASRLPQAKNGASTVVAFPQRQNGGKQHGGKQNRGKHVAPRQAARPKRRMWPETALLAASFFLGVLIGLSGQALPTLQNIAIVADDESALGAIAGLLLGPDRLPDQEAL